jgi:hypothetical protein
MDELRNYQNYVDASQMNVDKMQGFLAQAQQEGDPQKIASAQKAVDVAQSVHNQILTANVQTRNEMGRMMDEIYSDANSLLNGARKVGQQNVKLEVLTTPQIVELLSKQFPEKSAEELVFTAMQRGFFIKDTNTSVVNFDRIIRRQQMTGESLTDAFRHEALGHGLWSLQEFRDLNKNADDLLFERVTRDLRGNVVDVKPGKYTEDELFDMYSTHYLKGKSKEQINQYAQESGLWDKKTNSLDRAKIIEAVKDEIRAELIAGNLEQGFGKMKQQSRSIDDWVSLRAKTNFLARAMQNAAGIGAKPFESKLLGISYDPEVVAANRRAIEAMRNYNGEFEDAPETKKGQEIPEKTMRNDPVMRKRYGLNGGEYQTTLYAEVRDADGKVIGQKVPVTSENAKEGTWVNDAQTGQTKQTKGYGQVPVEFAQMQIPVGGSLNIVTDFVYEADGKTPVRRKDKELQQLDEDRRVALKNAIDSASDRYSDPRWIKSYSEDGESYDGLFSPEQINNIKNLPESVLPLSIKEKIIALNQIMLMGDGSTLEIDYAPRLKGKKYKGRKSEIYSLIPGGKFHLSKANNFTFNAVSRGAWLRKIKARKDRMPGWFNAWGNDTGLFERELQEKYLANTYAKRPGWYGLDPESPTEKTPLAEEKWNKFKDFLNMVAKDVPTVDNPWRMKTPAAKGRQGKAEGDIDNLWRKFRLDAIADWADSTDATGRYTMGWDNIYKQLMPIDEAGEPTEFRTPEQQRSGGISARFMPERPAEQEPTIGEKTEISPKIDADYMKAVESNDVETQQKLVDEAAKASLGFSFMDSLATQTRAASGVADADKQINFYQKILSEEFTPQAEELAVIAAEENKKKWIENGLNPDDFTPDQFFKALGLGLDPIKNEQDVRQTFEVNRKGASENIKKYEASKSRYSGQPTETPFKTGESFVTKVYHATPFGRLTTFDAEKLGSFTGAPSATKAHFFAGDPEVSETYFGDDALYLKHQGFLRLTGEQKTELIDYLRNEVSNDLDSIPDSEVKESALMLFEDLDNYDTTPIENTLHEVYVSLKNPLVYDFKGSSYREQSFSDLIDQAIQEGRDGVVFANTFDPGPAATSGSYSPPTNVIAVIAGNETKIKSADPVTYDDAGNVIPLSQRFNPKTSDIRFMPERPQDENIKPADIETSAKPEADAVIKPFSNALVSSAGLINFLPAYHGTPFEVDKFKLANIGTGEGAQAYGWGLYFAQARKTGEKYRNDLSGYDELTIFTDKGKKKGQQLDDLDMEAAKYLESGARTAGQFKHNTVYYAKQAAERDGKQDVVARIDEYGRDAKVTYEKNLGNLYKVDIDVKDEDLLDWDKPLSEQPESVRDALTALIKERTPKEIADVFLSNAEAKGGSLYALISDSFGESAQGTPEKRASDALLAAGIPGIRYLDGTSRKQGEGTYNYVVFDENLITILDKNDKPVAGELPTKQTSGGIQFMPQRGEGKKPKAAKKEPEKKYITIDAGDDETVPVLQEIRNGKPLTDPKGDAKFAQQKYDLLSSPFIDNYSGDNPEDTTKPNYKELAYDVSGVAQKKINAAIDSGAVDAAANIMVNKTNEAMKNADIAAGSGWYSRMRENLLNALGVEGRELLSQLLGATSAKTPVNENFLQAMDGYEGIKSGRYDSNRKAYLEMINAENNNELNDLIDDRNYIAVIKNKISTLNKAAKKVTGKKQKEIESESKKLKELIAIKPEDRNRKNRFSIVINASGLMPLRSNGKKFNANSMAVMKVIAGTWLDNRKAPKTPNFAGNLSGRTVQATIDVWAARFLRQILHEGFGKPWRIQPKSETGVSNEDFALGQVIMQRAAKKLGMNPDDLQAILWFAEKHNWDDRGWTGAEGAEKSSFDEIFSVFFPKGKKPLTFSEASEVLKSQKNKDESIDQKEDEETYEDTDEE